MGEQVRYSQLIPNSHTYGSLRNFLVEYEYRQKRTEELTQKYMLIGLRNTIKNEFSLQQLTFPDNVQGPYFTTIENIIEYVESGEWTLKDFIFRINNTLISGYDLKSE